MVTSLEKKIVFKPFKLCLKIDFVSHPLREKGLSKQICPRKACEYSGRYVIIKMIKRNIHMNTLGHKSTLYMKDYRFRISFVKIFPQLPILEQYLENKRKLTSFANHQ